MDRRHRVIPRLVAASCLAAAAFLGEALHAQDPAESPYESSFVEARGIRLHYLDFGGSGPPLLLLHGVHGTAANFAGFAPRFSDRYRTLALTRRGWGESESPPWGYDVATQAEDVLAFLDAMGIGKVVLISNSRSPELLYIAEHHAERLLGLVFLDHLEPIHWGGGHEPLRTFWEMSMRGACGPGEHVGLFRPRRSYRPHFIDDESIRIDVPTLDFVNREGGRLPAQYDYLTSTLALAASDDWCDPVSKAYFAQLAQDETQLTAIRKELAEAHDSKVYTEAFFRALGSNLRLVRLEAFGVTGYEYQRAPDLIYPHIRRFVDGLATGGEHR